MLVLIAILIALFPAIAIAYPLLRRSDVGLKDEGSTHDQLSRLLEAAMEGIKNAELEHAIGNLAEDDYLSLKELYMTEAARVMKAMDLEEQQGEDMLAGIEEEVRRLRKAGPGDEEAAGD